MKHSTPDALISRELLCFVRDRNPTVEEFNGRYGGQHGQVFHVLRKQGVIVLEADRIRLNRRHLSPDGEYFVWGIQVFLLNKNEVRVVRWGPEGPPVLSEVP